MTKPLTERDKLAKLIFITDNSNYKGDMDAMWAACMSGRNYPDPDYAYAIADGLIRAGYRREGGAA